MIGSVAAILQWWGDEPECESQHAKDGRAEAEGTSFLSYIADPPINPRTTPLLDFYYKVTVQVTFKWVFDYWRPKPNKVKDVERNITDVNV